MGIYKNKELLMGPMAQGNSPAKINLSSTDEGYPVDGLVLALH